MGVFSSLLTTSVFSIREALITISGSRYVYEPSYQLNNKSYVAGEKVATWNDARTFMDMGVFSSVLMTCVFAIT